MRTTGSVSISSWNSVSTGWRTTCSPLASTRSRWPSSHDSRSSWPSGSQPARRRTSTAWERVVIKNTYRRQLSGNVLLPSQGSPHKNRVRLQPGPAAILVGRLAAPAGEQRSAERDDGASSEARRWCRLLVPLGSSIGDHFREAQVAARDEPDAPALVRPRADVHVRLGDQAAREVVSPGQGG